MKLYVIKSENDNSYYCQNGNVFSWGSFDECLIADKPKMDNFFKSMPKEYQKTRHPLIYELNINEPCKLNGEEQCQAQILDGELPLIKTRQNIPIEEYRDKSFDELLDGTGCSKEILEILNAIENIVELKSGVQGNPNQRLSEADRKLCDIYHYIEFNKFSGAKGYKLSKLQKQILADRRTAKNDLLIINHINEVLKDLDTTSLTKLKYNCYQINDREYSPRISSMDLENL